MEENKGIDEKTNEIEETEKTIDPMILERHMKKLRDEQNIVMGGVAGTIAALIGAAIWAAVTILTDYQIGWMAIGVGFLVGIAIQFVGKGVDIQFQIMGGALALVGCLVGNLSIVVFLIAKQQGTPVLQIASNLDVNVILALLEKTFDLMDLLFYGLAAYAGFNYSAKTISEDELDALAQKSI